MESIKIRYVFRFTVLFCVNILYRLWSFCNTVSFVYAINLFKLIMKGLWVECKLILLISERMQVVDTNGFYVFRIILASILVPTP